MSAGYCITIVEGEIVHRTHAALLKIGLKSAVGRSKTGELTICVQLTPVPGLLQYGYEIGETSFGIIFKILPRVSWQIAWRAVWPGAFLTALLFAIGRALIALYISRASITSSFGAAGSLVTLLLWVYYSAQVFFLGAEFTQVYARRRIVSPAERTVTPAIAGP